MRAWTPGAQVLDSNDDMDEDNEIPCEIPDEFQLEQASQDESVQSVFDVKKDNTAADASLGVKSFTTGLQLSGLKEKF